MLNLKPWLSIQGLTVRELALDLEVPLKTAQDWVYKGVAPSGKNQDKITAYLISHCAHHWVIAVPNGPFSAGVCRHCGHQREFQNSLPEHHWAAAKVPAATGKGVQGKSAA